MRYRNKPIIVEAIQWTGDNMEVLSSWTDGKFIIIASDTGGEKGLVFDVLHDTWVLMKIGDWVIRGVQGEFYRCHPDVFTATYEPVAD